MNARWLAYKIAFDQDTHNQLRKRFGERGHYWQKQLFLQRELMSLEEHQTFTNLLIDSFEREYAR